MNKSTKRNLALLSIAIATTMTARSEPVRPYEGDMNTISAVSRLAPASRALEVLEFWNQAGPALWFAKDDDFDQRHGR